jgi:hypothetical protein
MKISRRSVAVAAGAATAVVGGVATNRVEGPWWAQALWFAVAASGFAAAARLNAAAEARGERMSEEKAAGPELRVSGTGAAVAEEESTANTGLIAPASQPVGDVQVDDTGDARAAGGSIANSGVMWT